MKMWEENKCIVYKITKEKVNWIGFKGSMEMSVAQTCKRGYQNCINRWRETVVKSVRDP